MTQYTKKKRFHKRAAHAYTQSSPKAQVYRTGVPNLSLNMYPLLNFLYNFQFRNYKGRHPFYGSELNCCKCTMDVPLQTDKYSLPLGPRGTCIPGWEYLLQNLLIMHDLGM